LEPSPEIAPRDPPVRYRKTVRTPGSRWNSSKEKNRQVRRMTACGRPPTLRLLRVRIGELTLGNLAPGRGANHAAERAAVFE